MISKDRGKCVVAINGLLSMELLNQEEPKTALFETKTFKVPERLISQNRNHTPKQMPRIK